VSAALDEERFSMVTELLERFASRHRFERRQDASWPRPTDNDAWTAMAQLGILQLAYPETLGGFAMDARGTGAVCRAIGRGLLIVPYLAAGVMLPTILGSGAPIEDLAALDLPAVLDGSRILAWAHAETSLGYAEAPLDTHAEQSATGTILSGGKRFVLDAPDANAFLVTARTPNGGAGLFLVERVAPGLIVTPRYGVDERPVGDLIVAETPAVPLISENAGDTISAVLSACALAACAEALGSLEEVLQSTEAYLQIRRAFGKSLSEFQVLRHRFADMHIAVEEIRAILEAAEQAWAERLADRDTLVAACKATTCRNGRFVSEQAIHLHGGIGMTDELDVSHRYKRQMMLAACFGDREHFLARHAGALFAPSVSAPAQTTR
jgi:alkylation response protein AidB-like acyl-CoA dehydrogenase